MKLLSHSQYVQAPPSEHYLHISLRAPTVGGAALLWSPFGACKIFVLVYFLAEDPSIFCLAYWSNEQQQISSVLHYGWTNRLCFPENNIFIPRQEILQRRQTNPQPSEEG
jgi:hypothetical protein